MNKKELADAVARKSGLKKQDCEQLVSMVLEAMAESLADGEKIQLTGFGTFEVKDRAGRIGHNPRTGEPVQVAPSRTVQFRPGKSLKDSL